MSSSTEVVHQGRTYYVFDGYITVHYSRKDRGRIIRVARCIPRGPLYEEIITMSKWHKLKITFCRKPAAWYWLQHGEAYGPYATKRQAELNAAQSQEN